VHVEHGFEVESADQHPNENEIAEFDLQVHKPPVHFLVSLGTSTPSVSPFS
jgi:hypothetical protein